MKKLILFSAYCIFIGSGHAQKNFALVEGQSAMVYALPKTELCIEIETERLTQKPGMFYQYSERYLATNKIITEEKTSFSIKSISIQTRALPDSSRTYNFPLSKSHPIHISVNSQGILCGINILPGTETVKEPFTNCLKSECKTKAALLTLGEESMMAGSEAKLAEGAAKQIYHLRESRINLLTAELEHLPSDGGSFNAMLEGLNNKERELTELFIGKSTSETQKQYLYLTPKTALNNQVLFRLSAQRGVVAADDLSGTPFYISIKPASISSVASDPKAKKQELGIYTLLPAPTRITINDGNTTYFSEQFQIPQFGKTVPIDQEFLEQKELKIRVDQQTGRLLGIE
jgi:Domain of unknown function (DUF4831)